MLKKIYLSWTDHLLLLFDLQIGGTPAVLRYLLEAGFMDGDCITGINAQTFQNISYQHFAVT